MFSHEGDDFPDSDTEVPMPAEPALPEVIPIHGHDAKCALYNPTAAVGGPRDWQETRQEVVEGSDGARGTCGIGVRRGSRPADTDREDSRWGGGGEGEGGVGGYAATARSRCSFRVVWQ
eukprot:6651662-Pyramimonas_sp.AAC.1